MINYYNIMQLPKTASALEIKKAFKKLAKKYHPDINPNNKTAEEKFKEINKAYAVLGNPDKRKKYDEELEQFHGTKKTKPTQSNVKVDFANMNSMFDEFFGKKEKSKEPAKTGPINTDRMFESFFRKG